MASTEISLAGSTRTTLLSMQGMARNIAGTQERLSTGRAVNSALDDALSFFTARSLNDRASDLASIKDGISDALMTIQTAVDGIERIESTLKQMKAIASAAKSETDSTLRSDLARQFDALRTQIDNLARDASYDGQNLISATPDSLTVKVNEETGSGQNTFSVTGEALDATTLGISTVSGSGSGSGSSVAITFADYIGGNKTEFDDWISGGGNYTLDSITNYPNVSQNAYLAGTGVIGGTSQSDSEFSSSDLSALSPAALTNFKSWANGYMSGGSFQLFDGFATNTQSFLNYDLTFNFSSSSSSSGSWTGSDYVSQIDSSIEQIESALSTVRTTAQTLGTSSSMLEIRRDFIEGLSSTLLSGAADLVNADMNEESADMLALQTRQQLGTIALGIAQSSEQSVLRLY